jgi:hypothetical protein
MARHRRVYWNGVFPDLNKRGTVLRRGTIRHEVLWDGNDEPTLEYVQFLRTLPRAEVER